MPKKISDTLVAEFVKECIVLERQTLKVASLKTKLRKAEALGAENDQLRFDDNISWRPPWKKLVAELAKEYMTIGQSAIYFKKLKRRFKKTNGAKKITILAPKYIAFQESVADLKKKLGLVKEVD